MLGETHYLALENSSITRLLKVDILPWDIYTKQHEKREVEVPWSVQCRIPDQEDHRKKSSDSSILNWMILKQIQIQVFSSSKDKGKQIP